MEKVLLHDCLTNEISCLTSMPLASLATGVMNALRESEVFV